MKSAVPEFILSHWHQMVSGFQTSTQEFYTTVERISSHSERKSSNSESRGLREGWFQK